MHHKWKKIWKASPTPGLKAISYIKIVIKRWTDWKNARNSQKILGAPLHKKHYHIQKFLQKKWFLSVWNLYFLNPIPFYRLSLPVLCTILINFQIFPWVSSYLLCDLLSTFLFHCNSANRVENVCFLAILKENPIGSTILKMLDFWLFLKKNNMVIPIENVQLGSGLTFRVSGSGLTFRVRVPGSGSNPKPVRRWFWSLINPVPVLAHLKKSQMLGCTFSKKHHVSTWCV